MRILLIADIHGNWPALRAVADTWDYCFFLGDLVDYALEPIPCIEWVQKKAHVAIRGNHDHGVAQRVITNGKNGYKYLSGVTRHITWDLLQPQHLRYLGSLPVTRALTLNSVRFLLVHATPRDPLDQYGPPDEEFWSRQLQNITADVVCVGHSHKPFSLKVGNKLVINPGSLGQPRDGDPRAAYAVWEDGRVELKRVAYPVEEVVEQIENSSLPELAKRMSAEVFRTGSITISANGVPDSNGERK